MTGVCSSFPEDVVPQAPEDIMYGLVEACRKDQHPDKIDLIVGAYRDDDAKPWVLPVVRKADEILRSDPCYDHEYSPIAGIPNFISKAADLILGADSPAIQSSRVASVQTISGTGAVHLGGLFLTKFYRGNRVVYLPDPTWVVHAQIFHHVSLPTILYPHYDPATRGLDFEAMCACINAAPERSIILLHACAHNPTGVDLSLEQWRKLAALMRVRQHIPFFDCAYQGFASGDLQRDAAAVRLFVQENFEVLIAQSFAKNMGLYGERTGCFHYVAAPGAAASASRVLSQLAVLQRSEISSPPLYGARIAALVLSDPILFADWEENLRTMTTRIANMRLALRTHLEELGARGSWAHITDQTGMFSYTGLTEKQSLRLRDREHVYMTMSGRISMCGLNTRNVKRFAIAVDKILRESS